MQFSTVKTERCFTDGDGPAVFQQCALKWVLPHENYLDDYGKYETTRGNGHCDMSNPPSFYDKICKSFHEKINNLR